MKTIGVLAVIAAALCMAPAAFGQATLKVLDPAPPVKVAKWVKGQEINTLEQGKPYVVEFWATWCGPCRVSIPHLTELAHKYAGKITFVGVDAFEHPSSATDTSYFAKVEKFVQDMGDKMDYHVCIDGPEGTMGKTWMDAANQNGIPTAFVVGKDGSIQWIGHPMELDSVLEPILAGTFDPKAAAAKREKAEAAQAEMQKLTGPINEAAGQGNWTKAIAEVDRVSAEHPEMARNLGMMKFGLLMRADQKAVGPYARKLADTTYKGDAAALNQIAWAMVDPQTPLKVRDYPAAIYVAGKAARASNYQDPMILDTLAVAHFKAGHRAQAIQVEQKAVALLDKAGNVPDETKQQIRATLARFKSAK